MIHRQSSSLSRMACCVLAVFLATQPFAHAARLGAIKTIPTTYDASKLVVFNDQPAIRLPTAESLAEATLPQLVSLATLRLDNTYDAWSKSSGVPMARGFPDIVDEVGGWHMESIESFTGSPGLFASSLWNMYQLTSSATWKTRALEASLLIATSPTLSDPAMGQAIGLLAYPTLKLAYEASLESPEDSQSTQAFLEAALLAASTLSRMYVRIPGVIKVRPTVDIAAEASNAGVASISPFAVFSSVEGAAAATGLLAWASTLPGGKKAWNDMALRNAKRIANDHIQDDGTFNGALVYSSLSSTTAPKTLSAHADPSSSSIGPKSAFTNTVETASEALEAAKTFVNGVMDTLGGHPPTSTPLASAPSAAPSPSSTGEAMDSWLSSIGGQATNHGLRQALGTMTMVEAAKASSQDVELSAFFIKAAEASALSLLASSSPSTSAAFDPLASAAAAAALADLSSIPTLGRERSLEYATSARSILVSLYPVATGSSSSQPSATLKIEETLSSMASKWLSGLIKPSSTPTRGPLSILLPVVGDEAEADNGLVLDEEGPISRSISQEDVEALSSEEAVKDPRQNLEGPVVSRSILPEGSMLADQLLLHALVVLSR